MRDSQSEASQPLSLSDEQRVDRLCDQFEAAHQNGQRPRIEDYLAAAPETTRDHLLRELIAMELDWGRLAGAPLDPENYQRRFPDRLAIIEAACQLAGSCGDEGNVPTTGPRSHETRLDLGNGEIPAKIGRYAIEKELGQGGFAVVYLAHDTELNRKVALKVPRRDRFGSERDVERFVEEARCVAGLDHPGIVRVHDVQRQGDSVYIVQQYIPGADLATFAKNHRFSSVEIAQLMVRLAQAVGFAHQAHLYHRDLKPANILMDERERPHVADFGLAVHVSRQHEHRGELAGSCPYMAPEQVRGEVHRLDGRTDIWGLGVMLYELLARTRPFHGHDLAQLFDEIEHRDPRPPRQIDPDVPRELSRICLACLAKRPTDRYGSMPDLIEDLQHWLDTEAAHAPIRLTGEDPRRQLAATPPKIVPKGLRCFDAGDADFFLELLPGPRDRYGLPKSIRFWKTRIEETDRAETFGVGLIYGPSGCGKSSFVQAGLLPLLAEHIVPVYVEATAADTELRLLKSLRRHCPDLPEQAALVELLSTLRDRGAVGGKKVLIVLDQFEQWLHAQTANNQLVDALRHCDGCNLQALVLVRDDFYRGVNRFFQALEERLIEGHNEALVDLFDTDHAKKVLTAFGQAYGKFPEGEITEEQTAFLDAAITGLAEESEVISVRLAVFAEMMKGKPWTLATLREVGGTEGVGVTFLNETFAARTAPPNYRLHEKGVRAVLQALLPELGTEIKGQMLSYEQLMEAYRYAGKSSDFDAVLGILDGEVRLITPTERDEGGGDASASTAPSARHYQLSHDYLVPSLRRWLRQKDTENARGRARLRLIDRTALWAAKPEVQQLPKWWEFFSILGLTSRRDWTEPQRKVISAAGRYYGTRTAVLALLLAVVAWGSRESYCRFKSTELVSSLTKASEDKVLETVGELQVYLPWCQDQLRQLAGMDAKTPDASRQQLHARLALVGTDESYIRGLIESLLTETPKYVGVIRDALSPYASQVAPALWQAFHAEAGSHERRFRAGLALAGYAPASERWTDDDYLFLVKQLVSSNAEHQPFYRQCLGESAPKCLPYLEGLFETSESPQAQTSAANAIAEFAPNDQQRIAQLLAIATPKQYDILFRLVAASPDDSMLNGLAKRARKLPPDDMSTQDRVAFGQRRAGAGITLLRLGEPDQVLPTFHMTDDPEAMTQFIHRCRDRHVRPEELLELLRLASSSSSNLKPAASSLARYAVLLALGEYEVNEIPTSERPLLLDQLTTWYAKDPSSGVHGACGWLLRQWGEHERVQRVDQTPIPYSSDHEWFTLAITANSPRDAAYRPVAAGSDGQPAQETSDDARPLSQGEAAAAVKQEANSATQKSGPAAAKDTSQAAAADLQQAQPQRQSGYVPTTLYFTFVVFPPGEYQFGSVEDEPDRTVTELRHTVTITRPFAMLDREVTFAELLAFDPDVFRPAMENPFVTAQPTDAGTTVSWSQSVAFCRWLTEQAGLSGDDQAYPSPESLAQQESSREPNTESNWSPQNWPLRLDRPGFRLPTEAEWEVASRAGTRTAYVFGSDPNLLKNYAWSLENSDKHVQVAKTRRPGLRGLFDTHGNVWEWCHDWYADYDAAPAADPLGPPSGSKRVSRGGGWRYDAPICRSSYRGNAAPTERGSLLGFRLAFVPPSRSAGGGEEYHQSRKCEADDFPQERRF